jgi:hypothetical protein
VAGDLRVEREYVEDLSWFCGEGAAEGVRNYGGERSCVGDFGARGLSGTRSNACLGVQD